jgi:hypothetical protein
VKKRGNKLAVLAIFPACAAGTLALSALRTYGAAPKLGEDFLSYGSIANMLVTNPSVFFAVAMLAACFVSLELKLLSGPMRFSVGRAVAGLCLASITYPVAMAAMLGAALPLLEPMDSDNPNPVPVPTWRHLVSESVPAVALLVGGLATVYLMALAFRVATGKRPRKVWRSALVVTFGAPLLTLLVGYARISRGRQPLGYGARLDSPLDLVLEPGFLRVPLVLLFGEMFLALSVGYWLYQAAEEETPPPA